jgi:hypothetical protein
MLDDPEGIFILILFVWFITYSYYY